MLRRAMSRPPPKSVTVIGAGLAGSACANAFALAGAQVTVFERGVMPAAGASGVPLAMFAPSVSSDDAPHSRLLRRGVHLLMDELNRLTAQGLLRQGSDWALTGVLERCIRTPKKLPGIWLTPQDPPALQSGVLASPSLERPAELFHGAAGWVNPAKLIAAWLAHPNIRLQTHAHITSLDDARDLASDLIVVACGYQTPELLTDTKSVLQPIRGQVEWGSLAKHNASAPANVLTPPTLTSPINGMGHWIESAHLWLAGATFQRDHLALSPSAKDVDLNFEKLAVLRPEITKPELERLRNQSKSWVGVRAAQKNRLPLVERAQGIQHSSVWVCAGLGSRGLSLAALCAQTLLTQYPEI